MKAKHIPIIILLLIATATATPIEIAIKQNDAYIEAYRTDGLQMNIPFTKDPETNTITVNEEDTLFLKNATIAIPTKPRGRTYIKPRAYTRENETQEWKEALPYCKNKTITKERQVFKKGTCRTATDPFCFNGTRDKWITEEYEIITTDNNNCFQEIRKEKNYWKIDIEHFSDWYINQSGGDYTNLDDCMRAINHTNDTCYINGDNFLYTLNQSLIYETNRSAIYTDASNIVIDCNNSIIRKIDSQSPMTGVYFDLGEENITLKNCQIEDYNRNIDNRGYNPDYFHNRTFTNILSIRPEERDYYHQTLLNMTNYTIINGQIFLSYITTGESIIENFNLVNCTRDIGVAYCIVASWWSDVTLNNFNITHDHEANLNYGIYMTNGGNNTIGNGTYYHANDTMIYTTTSNSTFTNITFFNTSFTAFYEAGTNISITNCTFNETGNSTYGAEYNMGNSAWNYNNGSINISFNATAPRVYNAALNSFTILNESRQNVTKQIDGTANVSMWLIDLSGVLLPNITLYVAQPNGMSCAAVATAYSGKCYMDVQDYARLEDMANYTFNTTHGAVIMQGSDPQFIEYNRTYISSASLVITGTDINVSGNTFYNHTRGRGTFFGISPGGTGNMWLNNLYYGLLESDYNIPTLGMNVCVNGQGNFYTEGLAIAPGDCGTTTSTTPDQDSINYNPYNAVRFTIKEQSSQNNITNYLYYQYNGSTTWTLGGTWNGTTYDWNYSTLPMNATSTPFNFNIRPYDGYKYGTYHNITNVTIFHVATEEDNLSDSIMLMLIATIFIYELVYRKNKLFGGVMFTAIAGMTYIMPDGNAAISLIAIASTGILLILDQTLKGSQMAKYQ